MGCEKKLVIFAYALKFKLIHANTISFVQKYRQQLIVLTYDMPSYA